MQRRKTRDQLLMEAQAAEDARSAERDEREIPWREIVAVGLLAVGCFGLGLLVAVALL